MSNNSKKIDQLGLFEILSKEESGTIIKAGSLNIIAEYKDILSRSISRQKYKREKIALIMSELLGPDDENIVTKTMIDTWTADSKTNHHMPGAFENAFCTAVDNFDLMEFKARKSGRFLLPGMDAFRAEIQKMDEEIQKKIEKREKMKLFLDQISRKEKG